MAGIGDYKKEEKGSRGYKMKGHTLPGPNQRKDEYPTEADKKFLKEQREESVHAMDYLSKLPSGPRAKKKEIKDDWGHDKITPGYEDPAKIQKLQREGMIPGSQTFIKKKK
jgi:hypothetical protein